jgi:NADPH-dependent curcumin reductase CurA
MSPLSSRKVVLPAFGPDFRAATRIIEEPVPPPASGQVLIRNRYAGVNGFFDSCICRNQLPYRRLTLPLDMGVEAVGEVIEVGEGVRGLRVGDAVSTVHFGGGYRELQVVDEGRAWKLREASPQALAVRPSGVSALVALEQVGHLGSGEVVAVSAAAGGLGHFAVQIAKRAGNHVIGTCGGPEKAEMLRALGCDRVIDHRAEEIGAVLGREYAAGVDLAFDSVGGAVFETLLSHLAVRGRLVMCGFASEVGSDRPGSAGALRIAESLYWKAASLGTFQNALFPEFADDASRRLLDLLDRGGLEACIDPTPFRGIERAADAVEHLLSGRSRGKVVLGL